MELFAYCYNYNLHTFVANIKFLRMWQDMRSLSMTDSEHACVKLLIDVIMQAIA